MANEEKILENLSSLRKSIGELDSRFKHKIGSLNNIIETAFEDARLIPHFIESLENTLKGINQEISELTENLSNSKDTIQSVKSEIEIQESTKNDLVVKEEQSRETVNSLDSEIAEFKQRNEQLQLEYDTVKQHAQQKKEVYNNLQINVKEELSKIETKIQEAEDKLKAAKEENKTIVYLMEAGLLDVPEAELVAMIAAHPEGMKIEDIKGKVKIPPVRVQPILNNLLEKMLVYNEHQELYTIKEDIKEEL